MTQLRDLPERLLATIANAASVAIIADTTYAVAAPVALLREAARALPTLLDVADAAQALDLSDMRNLTDIPDDELVVMRRPMRTWRALDIALTALNKEAKDHQPVPIRAANANPNVEEAP